MTDVQLCGWRVRSALPLPALPPWPDDARPVDITVGYGVVPPLREPIHDGPVLQIGRDGSCRFALPAVGAFLLREGREITIAAREGATEADLRLFLLGSLFGLLCHQRGLLPLHASAVMIGGEAVAFVGPSGIGKSTLAAALAKAGHPVVADDVLVVDPTIVDRPLVRPTIPRLRLWRDAVEGLGSSASGLAKARGVLDKYEISSGTAVSVASLPLGAIFHLEVVGDERQAACDPVAGLAAVMSLRDGIYRGMMADRMGLTTRLAANTMRVASTVRLHARLRRVFGFERLPATVAMIEAMVATPR